MRRIYLVFMIFVVFILLSGCFKSDSNNKGRITAPKIINLSFEGAWEITSCTSSGFPASQKDPSKKLTGKKAEFSVDGIKVADNIWVKTEYKVKRVGAEDYFLNKNGLLIDDLKLGNKEIFVYTITSGDEYLYEFIKLNDSDALLIDQNEICRLKRVSKVVDQTFKDELANYKANNLEASTNNNWKRSSGILLGLRFVKNPGQRDNDDIPPEYGYKTLWIAQENLEFHPVLETADIFLPRQNGFWKVESSRVRNGLKVEDVIKVYNPFQVNPTGSMINNPSTPNPNRINETPISKCSKIMFIGNDFISMEFTYPGNHAVSSEEELLRRMKFLHVDNVKGEKGVKIFDVAGEKGLKKLNSSRKQIISSIEKANTRIVDENIKDENFYLQRNSGHWFLKGRLSYWDNQVLMYSDFKLNVITPSALVRFDHLCIPWTEIKYKVPDATDAVTSPNKDFAIVVTPSYLYIYQIFSGHIHQNPYCKIRLNNGDSIIMAEWATDQYVSKWEEYFKNNDYKSVRIQE